MSFKAWKDCPAPKCLGRGWVEARYAGGKTCEPVQCPTCEAHFAEVERLRRQVQLYSDRWHGACRKTDGAYAEVERLKAKLAKVREELEHRFDNMMDICKVEFNTTPAEYRNPYGALESLVKECQEILAKAGGDA